MTNNWFTDALPYEMSDRWDSKTNVWHMAPFTVDGETELKWYIAGVFPNDEQAREFIKSKAQNG